MYCGMFVFLGFDYVISEVVVVYFIIGNLDIGWFFVFFYDGFDK